MALTAGRRNPVRGVRIGGRLIPRGQLISYGGSTPAPGALSRETIPTGKVWIPLVIFSAFTADANVANRTPYLTYDDGTNVFFRSKAAGLTAAGTTHNQVWATWDASTVAANSDAVQENSLPLIELRDGDRITITAANAQATDQVGTPRYLVVEYDA